MTGLRAARQFPPIDVVAMYDGMITAGSWWVYADPIATQRLRAMLRNDPAPLKQTMLAWSEVDDSWNRRSSILCQIKAKDRTDLDPLYACIAPSIGS